MNEAEAIEAETRAIFAEAGATLVQVKRMPFGWSVASKEHGSGCTSDDPDEWRAGAFRDPRELARHMIQTAGPDPQAPASAQAGAAVQAMVADTDAAPADDLDGWLGSEVLDENEEAEQDSWAVDLAPETGRVEGADAVDQPEGVAPVASQDAPPYTPPPTTAYPGLLIETDDLARERDRVISAITAIEEDRTDALKERLARAAEAIQTQISKGALGQSLTAMEEVAYAEAVAVRATEQAIIRVAREKRSAARRAVTIDMLAAMARDLEQGWP